MGHYTVNLAVTTAKFFKILVKSKEIFEELTPD